MNQLAHTRDSRSITQALATLILCFLIEAFHAEKFWLASWKQKRLGPQNGQIGSYYLGIFYFACCCISFSTVM